jgi:hypothetical protein
MIRHICPIPAALDRPKCRKVTGVTGLKVHAPCAREYRSTRTLSRVDQREEGIAMSREPDRRAAIDYHAEQARRAAESHGFRPARAKACPLVVAARRCRLYAGEVVCVCIRHHRALDHGRVWLDRDGQLVMTGEPYDVAGDELVDLCADLGRIGLSVTVSGRSFWNPGQTSLIVIRRRPNKASSD